MADYGAVVLAACPVIIVDPWVATELMAKVVVTELVIDIYPGDKERRLTGGALAVMFNEAQCSSISHFYSGR